MLIDQLGMAVATKKHAEVVKPGDDALKFHAVNEEHGQGGFGFADGVEEHVLKVLLVAH